jgi:hypothetical protein
MNRVMKGMVCEAPIRVNSKLEAWLLALVGYAINGLRCEVLGVR